MSPTRGIKKAVMNTKILLTCATVLTLAAPAWAEQLTHVDALTGEVVTNRIPGSVTIVPERELLYSFDPMEAPRLECDMVITSRPVKSPVFSSMARMPDTRRPVVACAPEAVPVRAAVYEPAPFVPPPVIEPARVQPAAAPPPIEELPHTASPLPLIGLLGLLALAGAALLRARRGLLG